ncbi:MAG: glycosyltransferase family 2 protein [Bdellovibrionales bacterium]|nr:glycosyltransferase family 2 protein [Bdellovibrionales bacterium]
MPRPPLSVTIITLNEENNIARAIESVRDFAQETLVVDAGSTDHTVEIARNLGATVITNPWRGYGQQKNFAQSHAKHDWVLNVDADEAVSPELAVEIQHALERNEGKDVAGYSMPRLSYYLGRWIRHGGWYPNRLVRLANRKASAWTEPDVHEELVVRGSVLPLGHDVFHYPFRNITEQIETNLRFSRLGSEALRKRRVGKSLALLLVKPIGKFVETYFVKGGFRDGIAGFIISVNAAHSIFLKYAYLFEDDGKKNESSHH